MLFKGRLRLPSDPGEGIPIDLELEDVYLSLESDGEDFGEWRLDGVEIKRLFSNQFSMLLDGEEMVFIADDALGFAYDGLSTIEDVKSRLTKRRVFKGRRPKKRKQRSDDVDEFDESDEIEADEPSEPQVADVPMPEVVPFFPETAPSFADSVADSATEDESIAPIPPRPIEAKRSDDIAPAAASEPPPPSPAVDQPEPESHPPITPGPVAPAQSAPLEAEQQPVEDEDDDEFVIEEVAAYGYVPNLASAVPDTSTAEEKPEPLEIEEADVATGAVHREVHPLGEPESVSRESEVHPLGEPPSSQPEPASEPEPVAQSEPVADPETTSQPEPIARTKPPAEPAAGQSGFGQWSSNGRVEAPSQPEPASVDTDSDPDRPQTQRTGRHERSSGRSRSLFGRKKSREPEEHEHRYESSKTVGGITRSVCAVCGHVSFAGEDVYQDW